MTFTDEQRTRWALPFHEAGHAVIGTLFGAKVNRAEVLRGGPRTNPGGVGGWCRYDPFDFATETRHREITAAGTIAEAVLWFGAHPTAGQIDRVLAKNWHDRVDLKRLCFAAGDPVAVPAEVLPLVVHCWSSIAELATRLVQHGESSRRDVLAALRIPADAPPAVVDRYVAAIRSGSAPGSFTVTAAAMRV